MAATAARGRRRRVREGVAEPRWVTRAQLETIHMAQLREHGGTPGVRDERLLQSALGRPRNKFAYGESDIATLAAAYAFGLARKHGFVDGNKRTAFQSMYVFLGLNGYDMEADEAEVVVMVDGLAGGRITGSAFAQWVRVHLEQS